MSAADTSREALIERVEELLHDLWNSRGRVDAQATAVVDAVVTPLVEERDRLRNECIRLYPQNAELRGERDAAIKRAEEAERRLAVAQERRDHWRRRFTDTAARATGLALNTHAATKVLDEYLAASDDDPHSTHDERCHERHERCLAHRVRNTLNPGDDPGKE